MARKTTTTAASAEGSDRDHRIRQIAYRLWEEEGYPHGRAEAHWGEATRLLDESETAAAPARTPAPRKAAAAAATAEPKVSSKPAASRAKAEPKATAAKADGKPAASRKKT